MMEWDPENVIITGSSDGVVRMWMVEFVHVPDENFKNGRESSGHIQIEQSGDETASTVDDDIEREPRVIFSSGQSDVCLKKSPSNDSVYSFKDVCTEVELGEQADLLIDFTNDSECQSQDVQSASDSDTGSFPKLLFSECSQSREEKVMPVGLTIGNVTPVGLNMTSDVEEKQTVMISGTETNITNKSAAVTLSTSAGTDGKGSTARLKLGGVDARTTIKSSFQRRNLLREGNLLKSAVRGSVFSCNTSM